MAVEINNHMAAHNTSILDKDNLGISKKQSSSGMMIHVKNLIERKVDQQDFLD